MNDSPTAIEFVNVTYRIAGNRTLISGLNLSIRRGETLMLLGRSGSGKTTTLKLINRLLEHTAGQVLVDGRSTAEWDVIQLRRHIGYAIQEAGLFPHYTVKKNVALVPRLEHWDAARIAVRACAINYPDALIIEDRPRWEYRYIAAYLARGEARPAYKRAFDAQLAVNKPASG